MHNLFRTLLLPIAALFAVTAVSAQNVSWKSTVEHLDGDMYRIVLEASIPAPYHMYDMGPYEGGPNATTITFTAGAGATLEGGVEQLSTPERHYDKTFEMEIGTFAGKALFAQRVKLAAEKGHAPARAAFGEMLIRGGEGVPRQPVLGLMWLAMAREGADPAREAWIIERHDVAFAAASSSDRSAALALIERQHLGSSRSGAAPQN